MSRRGYTDTRYCTSRWCSPIRKEDCLSSGNKLKLAVLNTKHNG